MWGRAACPGLALPAGPSFPGNAMAMETAMTIDLDRIAPPLFPSAPPSRPCPSGSWAPQARSWSGEDRAQGRSGSDARQCGRLRVSSRNELATVCVVVILVTRCVISARCVVAHRPANPRRTRRIEGPLRTSLGAWRVGTGAMRGANPFGLAKSLMGQEVAEIAAGRTWRTGQNRPACGRP